LAAEPRPFRELAKRYDKGRTFSFDCDDGDNFIMGAKEFDYYIFIDYSVDYLGYLIIEKEQIKEFLPKISKFKHYRELKKKKAYLDSIRKNFYQE